MQRHTTPRLEKFSAHPKQKELIRSPAAMGRKKPRVDTFCCTPQARLYCLSISQSIYYLGIYLSTSESLYLSIPLRLRCVSVRSVYCSLSSEFERGRRLHTYDTEGKKDEEKKNKETTGKRREDRTQIQQHALRVDPRTLWLPHPSGPDGAQADPTVRLASTCRTTTRRSLCIHRDLHADLHKSTCPRVDEGSIHTYRCVHVRRSCVYEVLMVRLCGVCTLTPGKSTEGDR